MDGWVDGQVRLKFSIWNGVIANQILLWNFPFGKNLGKNIRQNLGQKPWAKAQAEPWAKPHDKLDVKPWAKA